jgi:hypothetical protein
MDEYTLFLNTTHDPKSFIIKDVIPDGDCGFRACALNLNIYNLNLIDLLEKSNFENINDKNFNYKKNNSNKKWEGWDYKGKKLEHASKKLREITVKYILCNWNNPLTDQYLIIDTNNNTLGKYTLEYHDFSSKKIYGKEYLENEEQSSWVGNPELYALSKIFGVTINVYGLFRFFKNQSTTKMVKLYKNGKVPINTRIRLIQVIGSKYESSKHGIDLLYEYDEKGLNHYLFIKNKNLL